jgi:hypothetical protein
VKSELKELEDLILFGEHSDDEWLLLNKRLEEEFKKASDKEKQDFIDSGAGDLLGQIIEFMD